MIVYFAFLLSDLYGTVLTPPLPVWWFLSKGFNFRQNLAQRSLSIRGLYWQGLFPIKLTTAFPLHQGFVLTGFISWYQILHLVVNPWTTFRPNQSFFHYNRINKVNKGPEVSYKGHPVLTSRLLCGIKKFSYNKHPLKTNNSLCMLYSLQKGPSDIVRKCTLKTYILTIQWFCRTKCIFGPACNEFGYYEGPTITSKLFFSEKMTFIWYQCLKSLDTVCTAYNEHICMNNAACYKQAPVCSL